MKLLKELALGNIQQKARTTFTECHDWSGSGCHCMWGSPDAAFYKIFAGITVDHRRPYPVSIRPYFHKTLGYVDCEQIITEGTISVKWAYDGENVNVDLTVPVTAEVTLPGHGTMVLPAGAYHYNLILWGTAQYPGFRNSRLLPQRQRAVP